MTRCTVLAAGCPPLTLHALHMHAVQETKPASDDRLARATACCRSHRRPMCPMFHSPARAPAAPAAPGGSERHRPLDQCHSRTPPASAMSLDAPARCRAPPGPLAAAGRWCAAGTAGAAGVAGGRGCRGPTRTGPAWPATQRSSAGSGGGTPQPAPHGLGLSGGECVRAYAVFQPMPRRPVTASARSARSTLAVPARAPRPSEPIGLAAGAMHKRTASHTAYSTASCTAVLSCCHLALVCVRARARASRPGDPGPRTRARALSIPRPDPQLPSTAHGPRPCTHGAEVADAAGRTLQSDSDPLALATPRLASPRLGPSPSPSATCRSDSETGPCSLQCSYIASPASETSSRSAQATAGSLIATSTPGPRRAEPGPERQSSHGARCTLADWDSAGPITRRTTRAPRVEQAPARQNGWIARTGKRREARQKPASRSLADSPKELRARESASPDAAGRARDTTRTPKANLRASATGARPPHTRVRV